ncbi:MAPEG family protein [Iodidimonas sp. SYSU 1G8]|uniref:MAPEG family protein n=1 Tax=Iodidimonas sp. SYSU 1G8 TaxID=3133967 RepID=UPI0031FF4533
MTPTLLAMLGYALWTLLLTLTIATTRTVLVMRGVRAANEFSPTGEDVGGFSRRLARAHANCYENLPVFIGVVLAAILSGHSAVADQYALWILYARIFQSSVHMASTSILAVYLRFMFYGVQAALLVLIAAKCFLA